jgi:hypothetical protein
MRQVTRRRGLIVMDANFIRHWVIIIVTLVIVAVLIKALFFPTPMDILVLLALILALFALLDVDLFKNWK